MRDFGVSWGTCVADEDAASEDGMAGRDDGTADGIGDGSGTDDSDGDGMDDYDYADFGTQADAQAVYERDTSGSPRAQRQRQQGGL